MGDLSNLLEKIHDRRIRAGYREPRPPRERMPPDYIEPCVRYPTVSLVCFLAAAGATALAIALLLLILVAVSGTTRPAGALPPGRAVSKPAPPVGSAGFESTKAETAETENPPAETGAFSGTIIYAGRPSVRRIVVTPPVGPPVLDESLIVDARTHGVANVVIALDKVPAGITLPPVPVTPATFSIAGGVFVPHFLIVRAGQSVEVTNMDPIPGSVRTLPLRNASFNTVLRPKRSAEWKYDKAERAPIKINSDLHLWMAAYHVVTDHPWVAVTDPTGKFDMTGLPAGMYQFNIWHERTGWLVRKLSVEIKVDETTEIKLPFVPAKFGE
jgi:hypothetical protein